MTEELKQKGIEYACKYPSSQELGYDRLGYKRKLRNRRKKTNKQKR